MANFYSLLGFLSNNQLDYNDEGNFDIISSLPLEIASEILRYVFGKDYLLINSLIYCYCPYIIDICFMFRLLPSQDLLNAVSVCKNWKEVCKCDIVLRKKIRKHLRKVRKARLTSIIRDDYRVGGVSQRPLRSVAMADIVNICSSSRLQFSFSNGKLFHYQNILIIYV